MAARRGYRGGALGGHRGTQYIFALGYSDVDDVLFNTAGAAMGACAMLRLDHERQTKLLWRLGFLAAALLVIVVCGLVTGIIG